MGWWSPHPGLGLHAQVQQDGEQGQRGDGGPPRQQVHLGVSVGLEEEGKEGGREGEGGQQGKEWGMAGKGGGERERDKRRREGRERDREGKTQGDQTTPETQK